MQVHNPIKTRLPYNQVEGFSGCAQAHIKMVK